jgi:hypothetical protein
VLLLELTLSKLACSVNSKIFFEYIEAGGCSEGHKAIAFTRASDMGLTSAETQKLECFKLTANNFFIIFYEHLVHPLSSKLMPVYDLTKALFRL